jgi:hypothetical protein
MKCDRCHTGTTYGAGLWVATVDARYWLCACCADDLVEFMGDKYPLSRSRPTLAKGQRMMSINELRLDPE